jgi:hypothetical protein
MGNSCWACLRPKKVNARVIPLSELYAKLELGKIKDKRLVCYILSFVYFRIECLGFMVHTCKQYRGFLLVPENREMLFYFLTKR